MGKISTKKSDITEYKQRQINKEIKQIFEDMKQQSISKADCMQKLDDLINRYMRIEQGDLIT